MCGQIKFQVRDNMARFSGTIENCCMDRIGVHPRQPDTERRVRDYATYVLTNYLKLTRYQTGEGNVQVSRWAAGVRVEATIYAEGPDGDLNLYSWGLSPASGFARIGSQA